MIPEDVVAAAGSNDPIGRGLRGPLKQILHTPQTTGSRSISVTFFGSQ